MPRQVDHGQQLANQMSAWGPPRAANVNATDTGTDRAERDLTTQMVRMATSQWPTPTVADVTGGRKARSGDRGDEMLLNGLMASWPTPMAGTPAQNGNNYAGNNDGTRKMEVILGLRETVNGPKTGGATPTARDWRSGEASETTMERNARPLNEQMVNLASWGTPRLQSNGNPIRADDRRGRLEDQVFGPTPNGSNAPTEKRGAHRGAPNPNFACWLMGWPEWLTLGALKAIQEHKSKKSTIRSSSKR